MPFEKDPNELGVAERFWAKVDRSGDCWIWTGSRCSDGYGTFFVAGRIVGAHRFSLELAGVTLGRLHALHRCDNPPCVNPAHLYAGTQRDNSRDMVARGQAWQVQRTHCPRGHRYSQENTIIWGNGFRKCRECNRVSARNRYRRAHGLDERGQHAV